MTLKTKKNKKVIAVVPAFNEENTIDSVVTGLLFFVDDVIVVNDASTDATAKVAHSAHASVISHTHNQGYDVSLNDGVEKAYENGADIILTFDADGEHEARDIPGVIGPLMEGKAHMTAGDRQVTKHLGEKLFALYTAARYGIPDPLCGFKAYSRDVYERIGYFDTVRSTGTQLMIEGLHVGFRLTIVPIHTQTRVDTSRFYIRKLRGDIKIIRSLASIIACTLFKKSHRENVCYIG